MTISLEENNKCNEIAEAIVKSIRILSHPEHPSSLKLMDWRFVQTSNPLHNPEKFIPKIYFWHYFDTDEICHLVGSIVINKMLDKTQSTVEMEYLIDKEDLPKPPSLQGNRGNYLLCYYSFIS